MGHSRLTKREALDLITPVVDGEVDESTREAFFNFIKENADVRKQYESEKRIKNLTSSRCPYYKAPDSLKNRVSHIIREHHLQDEAISKTHFQDYPTSGISSAKNDDTNKKYSSSTFSNIVYALAASLMVFAAFWGLIFSQQQGPLSYDVEEYVYQHFTKNDGKMIEPSIATASLAGAEVELSNNFDFSMTIPPLKDAEFKGVVYTDFVPEFKSPLLEYYLPEEDQYIYIFAFKIQDLKKFGKLIRNQEAIKECLKPQDFHIENVNGKHVVSWKWNDTWYAAISNHHGKELASLVEPLNYSAEE
ncbi:MAG: hypothetical protein U5J95_04840 [Balneolaceae bacterium]|nr:hypothetical protein [Balneolaceae bacterium]